MAIPSDIISYQITKEAIEAWLRLQDYRKKDEIDHNDLLNVTANQHIDNLTDIPTRNHSSLQNIGVNDHIDNLTDIPTRPHSSLTGIGGNDHHYKDKVISDGDWYVIYAGSNCFTVKSGTYEHNYLTINASGRAQLNLNQFFPNWMDSGIGITFLRADLYVDPYDTGDYFRSYRRNCDGSATTAIQTVYATSGSFQTITLGTDISMTANRVIYLFYNQVSGGGSAKIYGCKVQFQYT